MLWADGVVVGMVVRERHRTVVPDEIAIWGPVSYILIHHDSLFLCGDGNLLSMATWVQETTDRVAKIFQTDRPVLPPPVQMCGPSWCHFCVSHPSCIPGFWVVALVPFRRAPTLKSPSKI